MSYLVRKIELDGEKCAKLISLTEQLLFLKDEELLEQQFLLNLAVIRWTEVVNIVAKN